MQAEARPVDLRHTCRLKRNAIRPTNPLAFAEPTAHALRARLKGLAQERREGSEPDASLVDLANLHPQRQNWREGGGDGPRRGKHHYLSVRRLSVGKGRVRIHVG